MRKTLRKMVTSENRQIGVYSLHGLASQELSINLNILTGSGYDPVTQTVSSMFAHYTSPILDQPRFLVRGLKDFMPKSFFNSLSSLHSALSPPLRENLNFSCLVHYNRNAKTQRHDGEGNVKLVGNLWVRD